MRLKRDKNIKRNCMDVTVKYEKATPKDSRIIINLFAEMLRLFIRDKKDTINPKEGVA